VPFAQFPSSRGLALVVVGLAGASTPARLPAGPPAAVAGLPPYIRAPGEVAGTVTSVGSDTMNNLVALWAEGFKSFYPNVREAIEGKGSASAPPALTEGTCSFGPMSREWKPSEIDLFQERHGYPPTVVPVAIDMLVIFVHRDNPLESLSLEEIDAIFSKNRKGGLADEIRTWGELGLGGEWRDRPISLYGRNASSGTYGFFKEVALFKGDFRPVVKEQPGSSAVVQAVASDRYGMGYSGVGYRTADVRAVPLRPRGGRPIPAEPLRAYTGEYPLTRFLLLSVNHRPGGDLDPLRREFLRYVLSGNGQADVAKDGYLPVTPALARRGLGAAGIEQP